MNERYAAVGVLCFVVLALMSAKAFGERLERIEEGVNVRNDLASGKATYMPGSACVIASTEEQTPAQIVNFARACAKAHEDWLKEQGFAE